MRWEDLLEVWVVDFEFRSEEGGRPEPVCLVAEEYRSGRVIRLWRDDMLRLRRAPFDTGPNSAICAYFASAEIGCFLASAGPHPTTSSISTPSSACETTAARATSAARFSMS
jgi:hypothetical protein